jgi:hypothetical protein
VVLRARADRLREPLLRLDMPGRLPLLPLVGREPALPTPVPVSAVMCAGAPAGARPQVSQKPSSMVPEQPGY